MHVQTVRRATWKSTKGKPVIVAVKSLKEGSMNEDDFKEEAQTMKQAIMALKYIDTL